MNQGHAVLLTMELLCERREADGHSDLPYLANYDMPSARLMMAGVEFWLNTPQPPLEASGTHAREAALNGAPSLSVLDGWWIEGCIEGITGRGITNDGRSDDRGRDADYLYSTLETCILPSYYDDHNRFIDIMRYALALNGSFFNTQRMLQQYVLKAYCEYSRVRVGTP
jgi:starch phosphorylase